MSRNIFQALVKFLQAWKLSGLSHWPVILEQDGVLELCCFQILFVQFHLVSVLSSINSGFAVRIVDVHFSRTAPRAGDLEI